MLEQTRASGALNVDETGWYLCGEPRTLWGAFSKQTAVLRIAPDRSKQHLQGLTGDEFAGIVGSDRFSAYNSLEPERRQVCWSHLRRDFTFHADLGSGPQEAFGLDGLEVSWNVFHAWRGSTGKRQRHVRALAKNLKLWPALWTFADVSDVEPTSNAAERGLRAAVIYRKLSLGSRSQGGETHDRTAALHRPDLPTATAIALRVPRRRPHREVARRPAPRAYLTSSRASALPQPNRCFCERSRVTLAG